MAKKSRRARRRRASRDVARTGVRAVAREESAKKDLVTGPGAGTAPGFAEQYAYVYGDLKRIAIIAGTLFAILIALSFVIG